MQPSLSQIYVSSLDQARQHYARGAWTEALRALEWAHIAGQASFPRHAHVHWWMLKAAWRLRDAHEVLGQLWRLLLTPLGHLSGRLPRGNTGRAAVNPFRPMPLPADWPVVDAAPRHQG